MAEIESFFTVYVSWLRVFDKRTFVYYVRFWCTHIWRHLFCAAINSFCVHLYFFPPFNAPPRIPPLRSLPTSSPSIRIQAGITFYDCRPLYDHHQSLRPSMLFLDGFQVCCCRQHSGCSQLSSSISGHWVTTN